MHLPEAQKSHVTLQMLPHPIIHPLIRLHIKGADAPIGVKGDHMQGAGEWIFSLRQIKMEMSGNKIGSNNASDTEILSIANTKLRKRKDRMTEYSASLLWTPKTIEQSIMVPQLELDVFHKKIKSTFPNF